MAFARDFPEIRQLGRKFIQVNTRWSRPEVERPLVGIAQTLKIVCSIALIHDGRRKRAQMAESQLALVTGATGCVGSHVVDVLRANGWQVRAMARTASASYPWNPGPGVEVVAGDLTDGAALRSAAQGVDAIFHCAAKVGDWGDVAEYRQANVEGTRHLLEAVSGTGLTRFIHFSSLGIYEARDHYQTDETTPPPDRHIDGYTQSKVESEKLALEYAASGKVAVTVLRPGFIYGPRDRTVLPKLVENLKARKVKYLGSGKQAMNCVFVRNLVDASMLALTVPEAIGQAFNITDGENVSKRRFIEAVADGFGVPRPGWFKVPLWLARPLASWMESGARARGDKQPPLLTQARVKFLGLNLDFSIGKAKQVLGYAPHTNFETAMRETVASYHPGR